MPIYEYYCAQCERDFDVIRPVSRSDEPTECPECGTAAERQLSNFAFKSNTFTAPKFKASLEKPMRSREKPVRSPEKPMRSPEKPMRSRSQDPATGPS